MPRILHLKGIRNKSLRLSKHGRITQPSLSGGIFLNQNTNPDILNSEQ